MRGGSSRQPASRLYSSVILFNRMGFSRYGCLLLILMWDGGEDMINNQENDDIKQQIGDIKKLGLLPQSIMETISDNHINVKDFGAKGDAKTDDTACITNALQFASDKGVSVFFPKGIYNISSTLYIPNNVSIFGVGNSSELRAVSPISILTLESDRNEYGNRYGLISELRLNGNGKSVAGMNLSYVVVMRSFRNIQIDNVNGVGIILDSTQNCIFDSVNIGFCLIGVKLLNGAGNNKFVRCAIYESKFIGVLFDADTSLYSYNNNAFNNTPQGNEFDKCIIERGTAEYGVCIEVGKRNAIKHCDITSGTVSKVYISRDNRNSLNRFEICTLISTGPLCIKNNGYKTFVSNCIFEGYPSPVSEVFWTTNLVVIDKCHFGSKTYRIINKSGDQKMNIKYTPLIDVGPTTNRPDNKHMGVVQYFDTSLNKPIWWDTICWKDAFGNIV